MFGCLAADAMGRPLDRFIPERARASHRDDISRFGETGFTKRTAHPAQHLTALHADGKEFPIEASISAAKVDGHRFYTAIVRDVSERRRMERSLHESQALLERRVEEHVREAARRQVAESLSDILAALNSARTLDEAFEGIVAQASRLLATDAVALFRLDDEQLVLQSARGMEPDAPIGLAIPIGGGAVGRAAATRGPAAFPDTSLLLADIEADAMRPDQKAAWRGLLARYASVLAVPLLSDDTVRGGLVLCYRSSRSFSSEDVALAAAFGRQAALAMENRRVYEQAQLAAALEERQRLARELHDSVTQSLFSMTLLAEAGRRLAARDPGPAAGHLERLGALAHGALGEMRLLVYELRPAVLEREGLVGALQQRLDAVERRSGITARLVVRALPALPGDVEGALFGIAQEALNNALKHAAASAVTVRLTRVVGRITLSVEDDGGGFDARAAARSGGLGLVGMRERADRAGGTLRIRTGAGTGTRVTATLPLQSAA
jgi:PAS domain S-box-containing protein